MTEVSARSPSTTSTQQERPPTRAPRLGFLPGLEGFRGIALLAVLVVHIGEFLVPSVGGWLLPGGFLGVDIFFALSGFLITALLLPDLVAFGRARFGKFYWRRALRLVPALLGFIIAHYIYAVVTHSSIGDEHSTQLWALTFTYNWRVSTGHLAAADIANHFDTAQLWTLALEGQMYLIWPIVLTGLWKLVRAPVARVAAIGGMILGVIMLRVFEYRSFGHQWVAVYERTDARVDTFLVGALVAMCWVAGLLPRRRTRDVLAAIGGVTLIVVMWRVDQGSHFLVYGGFTLVALLCATVIAGCVDERSVTNRVFGWRPLRLLGRVSYSVYLYHLGVYIWIVRYHSHWNPWAKVGVGLGLSVVLGGLSYLLVERPALRRPKLFGRRKQGQPAEAVNAPAAAPASG